MCYLTNILHETQLNDSIILKHSINEETNGMDKHTTIILFY